MGCLSPDTSRAHLALRLRSGPGLSPAKPASVLKAGLEESARYGPCSRLSHAPFSFLLAQFWSNGRKESIRTLASGSNAPSLAKGQRHGSLKPFTRSSAMWWKIGWTAGRKR